jgi:hypothetical protein
MLENFSYFWASYCFLFVQCGRVLVTLRGFIDKQSLPGLPGYRTVREYIVVIAPCDSVLVV